jgi:hypothetical protein
MSVNEQIHSGEQDPVGQRVFLTLTFPKRLARNEATMVEQAEMMLVTKKIDPSLPSSML